MMYNNIFDFDTTKGIADLYPAEEEVFIDKTIPCDHPDYIRYEPFVRNGKPYGKYGWYYQTYNPLTGEGKGVFGTPEDPHYSFEFALIEGKLKTRNCGLEPGCFWTDFQ